MTRLYFPSLLFLIFIFLTDIFPQEKSELNSELFRIIIDGRKLVVNQNEGPEIYSREFQNPSGYLYDLDSDGNDELLIRDEINSEFHLFVYNLLDTFYLAGEINSGIVEPYETYSGELEGLIIVSGNSDFAYLNEGSKVKALPINCWKFEDGEIFSVNEELYDIFLTENEALVSSIETEVKECSQSKSIKSVIAAVYINSLNADDKASAESFLKTFYLCDDLEKFREELNNLFKKEN